MYIMENHEEDIMFTDQKSNTLKVYGDDASAG